MNLIRHLKEEDLKEYGWIVSSCGRSAYFRLDGEEEKITRLLGEIPSLYSLAGESILREGNFIFVKYEEGSYYRLYIGKNLKAVSKICQGDHRFCGVSVGPGRPQHWKFFDVQDSAIQIQRWWRDCYYRPGGRGYIKASESFASLSRCCEPKLTTANGETGKKLSKQEKQWNCANT